MRKFITLFLILFSILQGGIGDERLSLIAEGRGGLFQPALKDFSKIYGDENIIECATLGIGYRNTFLVARYRLFEAEGKSIVSGIDLDGYATWKEEFISLGIRTYQQKLIYAEIAFVIGSIEESISTNEPSFTALNSTFLASDNRGASIALGISIPVVWIFNLSGEAEYLYVETIKGNNTNRDRINIGGLMINFGISLVF